MIVRVSKAGGQVNDQRSIEQLLAYLPNDDYVLTVETRREWSRRQGRTNDQNALMWAYFADIAKVLNSQYGDDYWDSRKVHDYLCNLWKVEEITPDGEVWSKPMRTSQLSKAKMTEFLQKVQAWLASEHGCNVPLPDDDGYEDFKHFINTI